MNSFGASEGDTPRPWWRSRARHEAIRREEAGRDTVRPDIEGDYVRTARDFIAGQDRGRTAGALGFGLDEKIRLDSATDMAAVRALIHLLQDEPDKTRSVVRALPRTDLAVIRFYADDLSRLVSEEDMFRTDKDRRTAQDRYLRENPDAR